MRRIAAKVDAAHNHGSDVAFLLGSVVGRNNAEPDGDRFFINLCHHDDEGVSSTYCCGEYTAAAIEDAFN